MGGKYDDFQKNMKERNKEITKLLLVYLSDVGAFEAPSREN